MCKWQIVQSWRSPGEKFCSFCLWFLWESDPAWTCKSMGDVQRMASFSWICFVVILWSLLPMLRKQNTSMNICFLRPEVNVKKNEHTFATYYIAPKTWVGVKSEFIQLHCVQRRAIMTVKAVVVEACTTCHKVDCNVSRGIQMQADIALCLLC